MTSQPGERTAVVAVDLQNDYCHPEGLCCGRGQKLLHPDRLVDRAAALLRAARSAGVLVVYCQMTSHGEPEPHGPWAAKRAERGMTDVCLDGSWGQQILAELASEPGDVVVRKPRFSGFLGTELDLVLRGRRIETCYFAGVATNGCVDLTLRDAYQRDYRVYGVADAVDAYDRQLHDAALANWARAYGEVVDTAAAIDAWT